MMEWQLQKQCFQWFVTEYPAHSKLLCYNLNNRKDKSSAIQNKKIGLQKGRADLSLYFNGTAYFFELKTRTGEQSYFQKELQMAVEIQGFEYFLVRDLEYFKLLIDCIIDYAPRHGLTLREYIEQYLT